MSQIFFKAVAVRTLGSTRSVVKLNIVSCLRCVWRIVVGLYFRLQVILINTTVIFE
jgi:hypothetical protein